MTLRLSILDQSPIPAGGTPAEALIATLQLARRAESLGYHRFWVAEHHGAAGFAGTAPEIMVASLLEHTRQLRIGSGGVLLPRYKPLKVAEVFRVLGALHPGRVDLGIGRAGGAARDFPQRFAEVIDLLGTPYPGYIPPPVWLLGAGSGSARLAGALGIRYAFAHFLMPQLSTAALDAFHGSTLHAPAQSALAVRVVVADTEAKARELTAGFLLWRSRKDLGHNEPFPSPATVRSHSWTAEEDARAGHNSQQLVAGTPHEVKAELTALARAHRVDEIIVNTLTHDPLDRLRSYELLAEAFQLAPRA
ncbi:MsnO8 family LLM class oxidoreductase [Streptomyces sp. NPDC056653]|uniref:MsnO8 family LLM class oxidoreductase n=1 Tax=Streptomyces sp. NPDC056653 TaxID=3345894 RepID=UPI0036A77054